MARGQRPNGPGVSRRAGLPKHASANITLAGKSTWIAMYQAVGRAERGRFQIGTLPPGLR